MVIREAPSGCRDTEVALAWYPGGLLSPQAQHIVIHHRADPLMNPHLQVHTSHDISADDGSHDSHMYLQDSSEECDSQLDRIWSVSEVFQTRAGFLVDAITARTAESNTLCSWPGLGAGSHSPTVVIPLRAVVENSLYLRIIMLEKEGRWGVEGGRRQ